LETMKDMKNDSDNVGMMGDFPESSGFAYPEN
jgi:hypothetical protein